MDLEQVTKYQIKYIYFWITKSLDGKPQFNHLYSYIKYNYNAIFMALTQ
jgi:hypothetical protein